MRQTPDHTTTAQTRWGVGALALAMLLSSLGTSVANVGLATFARAFGASFQAAQWVVLAYLLAVTSLIVAAGRLGDLVGRKRLLLAGISLFAAASVLAGLATGLSVLVAARAAQGIGAAIMMALAVALVGEMVPAAQTGRAMGFLGTMSAIGTALGPSLGGLLIGGPGWRWIFFANLPLAGLAWLLARRHLAPDRGDRAAEAVRLDPAGTVTLAAALAAYSLAMTMGRGRFGPVNLALLAAAAVGAGLFVAVEGRVPSPLIRPGLLRSPSLRGSLGATALVATVMMATLVVGPFYLARVLGLSPTGVGLAASVGPVVAALFGVPAGRLTDRFGTRPASLAGLGGILLGTGLLAALPAAGGLAGYLGPMAAATAGYALFQTANNAAVMGGIPRAERGVAAGLLGLSRNLGLISGASAMGAVFALGSGDPATAGPGAVAAGMRSTFAVAAILAGIAVVAVGRRGAAPSVPAGAPSPAGGPGPQPATNS